MPPKFFTAGQVGSRLARVNPDRTEAFLTRQVRGWTQAECFPSGGTIRLGIGKTAPVMYSESDVLLAAIFAALTATGLPESELRNVTGVVDNFDRGRSDKQRERGLSEAGLAAALDGIKAGEEDWILTLRINAVGEVVAGSWSSSAGPSVTPDWRWLNPLELNINVSALAAGLFVKESA